jgi:hypothetical protein
VDTVDAFALARNLTRGQMVCQILGEWAAAREHEANVLHRVKRRNPPDMDALGALRKVGGT